MFRLRSPAGLAYGLSEPSACPDRVVCDLAQRFSPAGTEAGGEGTECRIGDMALRFRRAWRELPSTERATELCCSRREPTGSRAPVLHYVRGRE